MLDPRFIILGALLDLIGGAKYALSTLKGETQPNRVSWLMWAAAPLIAFAAEVSQGVGLLALMTFFVGFVPVMVLAASFANRRAYWKLTIFDVACGAFSALALVLWWVTRTANIAIVFSVLADLFASVPTVVKSYRFPKTEHPSAYAVGVAFAGITLLTIKQWNVATAAFPIYIFLINSLLTGLILFPGLRLSEAKS